MKIDDDFLDIIENFKNLVTQSLLENNSFPHYKGIYLFYIDKIPKFIVHIQSETVFTENITNTNAQIHALPTARATIHTDSLTLKKLLMNQIRARIAFLTGKVKIKGDIFAFIKMVTDIKKTSTWNNYSKNKH